MDDDKPFQSSLPISYTLNNGVEMPTVGLGSYRIRVRDVLLKTMDYALEAGYRMFDTSSVYGNERSMKDALRVLLPKHNLVREDIFITSRLSPTNHGSAEVVAQAYERSLKNLNIDHLDLYLVNFPGCANIPAKDKQNSILRDATWQGMTKLYDQGMVDAIGVSNFTVRHLQDLIKRNHGVIPAVNQVEFHPFYHQKDLLKYCKANEIVVQAYCSFGGTSTSNQELLEDPVVKKIALKHKATCAQVLLVWALQQDVAVIPKSISPERIKENITYNFKLTDDEMKAISVLGVRNTKYAWNPSNVA